MPIPETVNQLRVARSVHKAWSARAEALVNGLPSDDTKIPVPASACSFGKWLKVESKRLQSFSVFSQIEQIHHDFHRIYADIYHLLFAEAKGISKLFGQGKKEKVSNQTKARMLLPTLQSHYDTLMELLEKLEKDYIKLKARAKSPMQDMQTKSFRDVSKMMDALEKDVDSWLK